MLNYYINLSDRILKKAKLDEDTSSLRKELFYVTIGGLESKINTDELKLIFWENIYNAYLLIMLKEQILPKNIVRLKRIKIAHYLLSLNDIEYGILRKPKFKIGFYSLHLPFYSSFIKKLAVEKNDKTIFVRLNKNILTQAIYS